MNKKTTMWVGVGVVALAAYYFWHKSQTSATTTPKQFAGADGVFANAAGCPSGFTYSINSNNVAVCDNGKGWRYRTNPIR